VNVADQPSEDNKKIIIEKLLAEHGEGSNIEFSEDPAIMGGLSIKSEMKLWIYPLKERSKN